MLKYFLYFLTLIPFVCPGQDADVPLWKVKYDSAQLYWKTNPQKTIKLLRSAEKIALNDLGLYDENYIVILNELGLAFGQLRNYKKGEEYYLQSLKIQQELFPAGDPAVLHARCNLATLILNSGDEIQAKRIFREVLDKSTSSGSGATYLIAAGQLSRIYEAHEKIDSAIILIRNGLAIQLKDAPAQNKYELWLAEGRLLKKKKKYEEGAAVLTSLLKNVKAAPPDYPGLPQAVTLELSLIDIEMGLYGTAENNLLQLYRELKSVSQTDITLLAELTNSLAYIYEKLGVYDKALAYYQESLTLCVASFGSSSVNCETIQNNIAGIYLKEGNISKAIAEYERFIKGANKNSKGNSVYLIALNNLATAYRQNNQYDLALQNFNDVYNSLSDRGLLNEDLAATVMNNIGVTYTLQGDYTKATENFEKVLRIKESIYGQNSTQLLDITGNLAVAYWVGGKVDEALPLFQRSLQLGLREVKYVFQNLTEPEQIQFYQKQKQNFERFNTLAVQKPDLQPDMLVQMFNNQLFLKSLVFFTNKSRNNIVQTKTDPQLRSWVDLAQIKGAELGQYYQLPAQTLRSLGVSLRKKENEIDSLEKLIRHTMYSDGDSKQREWKEVRQALKADEASVEIIRFRKYDVLRKTSSEQSKSVSIGFTDSVYYAALVTTQETTIAPKLILLKNGNNLERRFLSFYRNTTTYDLDDTISYSKFWRPIEKYLTGKRNVYISNDGVYHQINLNAIHDRAGKFIIEKFDLSFILNSGSLAARNAQPPIDFSKMVLMGNPTYNSHQFSVLDAAPEQPGFESLPGSLEEINGIMTALKLNPSTTKVFTRLEASEVNLRKLHSPTVLHIATHGFFSTNLVYLNEHVKNDYLFHSGIILAGTKVRSENIATNLDTDGIMTAYDVMSLDLRKTDLVVLSACETGLGRIETGEGVFGLQRSFLQAGARDIMISLWKVDDKATRDLMIRFYSSLAIQSNIQDALKTAQIDMLRKTNNRRLWGAFVMISGN